MIIKKRVRDKVTGKISVTFTTNKEGYKILFDEKGVAKEVKMTSDERMNRDHGYNTDGKGAVGSKNKQIGRTKINMKFIKQQRDELESVMESSDKDIQKLSDRIEKLTLELRKNKVTKKEIELKNLERELMKKQLLYKSAEQYISKDKENLKAKNCFYVQDKPNEKVIASIDAIVDEIDQRTINEEKDILSKIDRILTINEKRAVKEADVENPKVDDLKDPLETDGDAPEVMSADEEDPTAPTDEDPLASDLEADPTDEETPEDLNADEDAYVQKNEVENLVTINNYDTSANNVYDFYDSIFPKLIDPTSKKAFNAEYSTIPQDKLKVTPSDEFYKRVVSRLSKLNKAEDDKINSLSSADSEATDDSGDGELKI
jgi:hypothetical protein